MCYWNLGLRNVYLYLYWHHLSSYNRRFFIQFCPISQITSHALQCKRAREKPFSLKSWENKLNSHHSEVVVPLKKWNLPLTWTMNSFRNMTLSLSWISSGTDTACIWADTGNKSAWVSTNVSKIILMLSQNTWIKSQGPVCIKWQKSRFTQWTFLHKRKSK